MVISHKNRDKKNIKGEQTSVDDLQQTTIKIMEQMSILIIIFSSFCQQERSTGVRIWGDHFRKQVVSGRDFTVLILDRIL